MLAMAVDKDDPLGERRRQASDSGDPDGWQVYAEPVGPCLVAEVDDAGAVSRRSLMDPDWIAGWLLKRYIRASLTKAAPKNNCAGFGQRPTIPTHGQQEVLASYHGYYRQPLFCIPLYIFDGDSERPDLRPVAATRNIEGSGGLTLCRFCERDGGGRIPQGAGRTV